MRVYIKIPVCSVTYEIKVDDDDTVGSLIASVIDALHQKENIVFSSEPDEFLMMHSESKTILKSERTLKNAGIGNGDTLIIV